MENATLLKKIMLRKYLPFVFGLLMTFCSNQVAWAGTPGQAYLGYLRNIYYAKKLDDMYPSITDGNIAYYNSYVYQDPGMREHRLQWYKDQYITDPKPVEEHSEGNDAFLVYSGIKTSNGKRYKVRIQVKLVKEEGTWRIVTHSYDGPGI